MQYKELVEFFKQRSAKDGLGAYCKICAQEASLASYHRNRDARSTRAAAIYAANPEAQKNNSKRWYANNKQRPEIKERRANTRKRWFIENKGKIAFYNAKRKGATSLPKWANKDAVLLQYKLAKDLTEGTGEEWHVDHIVPLIHPRVCGLHCEANLRVITGTENYFKNNRFWPDMPA